MNLNKSLKTIYILWLAPFVLFLLPDKNKIHSFYLKWWNRREKNKVKSFLNKITIYIISHFWKKSRKKFKKISKKFSYSYAFVVKQLAYCLECFYFEDYVAPNYRPHSIIFSIKKSFYYYNFWFCWPPLDVVLLLFFWKLPKQMIYQRLAAAA